MRAMVPELDRSTRNSFATTSTRMPQPANHTVRWVRRRPFVAATAALALAEDLLSKEAAPGGILFVADALDPADADALNRSSASIAVLAMLPEGTRDRGLDALSATVIPVTPDTADAQRVDGLLNTAFRRAQLENASQPWEDRAHWLAWPAALLDSCMGSAVHSMLPAGVGFTIVEVKIDFVRSITVRTGHVRAEGKVVRVGRQIGQSDGVIYDDTGQVLAKGSATCLLFRGRQ